MDRNYRIYDGWGRRREKPPIAVGVHAKKKGEADLILDNFSSAFILRRGQEGLKNPLQPAADGDRGRVEEGIAKDNEKKEPVGEKLMRRSQRKKQRRKKIYIFIMQRARNFLPPEQSMNHSKEGKRRAPTAREGEGVIYSASFVRGKKEGGGGKRNTLMQRLTFGTGGEKKKKKSLTLFYFGEKKGEVSCGLQP